MALARRVLIAVACGEPPEGRARWTLRLLAGQMVERAVVDGISHETVRRTLKKRLKPHTKVCWCIPPSQSGEFVTAMGDVLKLYEEPYDSGLGAMGVRVSPTSCLFVSSMHTTGPRETGSHRLRVRASRHGARVPVHRAPGKLALPGHHRESDPRGLGTADQEPGGHYYPNATKVRLVMDNLNTHTIGSLYETFPPEEARRIAEKLEIHYTRSMEVG